MTRRPSPLVSVIVPVLNEERLLPEAIDCIRRQADARAEIVAVHGRSTDRTGEVLERLRDVSEVAVAFPAETPAEVPAEEAPPT